MLHWYMIILARHFWTLGNDYFTTTFGLWGWDWPEKVFLFLFTHFLNMEKYSIYSWITLKFWDSGSWFPFWLKTAGLWHVLQIGILICSEVSSGNEVSRGKLRVGVTSVLRELSGEGLSDCRNQVTCSMTSLKTLCLSSSLCLLVEPLVQKWVDFGFSLALTDVVF